MRRRLPALLLLLAACVGSGEKNGEQAPLKWQAWCYYESKPLHDWHEDKAVAEEARRKHNRLFPFHEVRIWSGRPKEE